MKRFIHLYVICLYTLCISYCFCLFINAKYGKALLQQNLESPIQDTKTSIPNQPELKKAKISSQSDKATANTTKVSANQIIQAKKTPKINKPTEIKPEKIVAKEQEEQPLFTLINKNKNSITEIYYVGSTYKNIFDKDSEFLCQGYKGLFPGKRLSLSLETLKDEYIILVLLVAHDPFRQFRYFIVHLDKPIALEVTHESETIKPQLTSLNEQPFFEASHLFKDPHVARSYAINRIRELSDFE